MKIGVNHLCKIQHPRKHDNQRNIQYKQRMQRIGIEERLPAERNGVFRIIHSTHSAGSG